jgi:hypothetical protein
MANDDFLMDERNYKNGIPMLTNNPQVAADYQGGPVSLIPEKPPEQPPTESNPSESFTVRKQVGPNTYEQVKNPNYRPPGPKPTDEMLDIFDRRVEYESKIKSQLPDLDIDVVRQAERDTLAELYRDKSYLLYGRQTKEDESRYQAILNRNMQIAMQKQAYARKLYDGAMNLFDEDVKSRRKYEQEMGKETLKGMFDIEKARVTSTSKAQGDNPYDPKDKAFDQWDEAEKESAAKAKILQGKNPQFASRDSRGKAAFEQYFNQYINKKNITPAQVGYLQSKYKSLDMSLKNMTKQEAPMEAFVMNIGEQINKVQQLYNEVDRAGVRLVDLPLRELKVRALGSGKEANLASYLIEISNEIGKLSTGSSASIRELSDSAQEQWAKIHDKNLSFKDIMIVLNGTRDQGNMRISTWRKSIDNVKQEMEGLLGDKPQQAQQGGKRDLSTGVQYLKAAKDRQDTIKRIQALSKNGWSREDLQKVVSDAGIE